MVVGINYAPEPTGTGPYTEVLANSLSAAGFRVSVITGVPHYPQWRVLPRYRLRAIKWEASGGVRITRLRHFVPSEPGLTGRALMEATFTLAAIGPICLQRADAIICVTPSLAGLAAATLGRRSRPLGVVVQDLTGAAAAQTGAASGEVASRIASAEMLMLSKADAVGVVASGFVGPLIAGGVEPERIVELPNPSRVEMSELSRLEAQTQLGWSRGRPLVIHTGNMGLKQGLESVIEAAAAAPELDFVLVGDGARRKDLEAEVRSRALSNIRVELPVDEAQYPVVLAAADVLLLSEAPTVESMSLPSKITSYVAANRPIVASVRADGLTGRYVREHGIAHLVQPGGEGIAQGVRDVLADREMQDRLAVAQHRLLRTIGVEGASRRYVAFAQSLTQGQPKSARTVQKAGSKFLPLLRVSSRRRPTP